MTLKRPTKMIKWMYYFILYTLITFLIGLVIKIILVFRIADQTHTVNNAEDNFDHLLSTWKQAGVRPPQMDHFSNFVHIKTLDQAQDQLDTFRRQDKEVRAMLILQIAIIVLTIVIYSRSLKDLRKIWKDKKHQLTSKMYKAFKIEYIIFLSIFIIIDTYATYLLFKESPKISGWTIYSIVSLIIPAILAMGSLYILHKNKSIVVA